MTLELENPFSVTKATEFNDSEINEYWVNFNTADEQSIEAKLNPQEFLAKYVIGGKGCGKTHILRYFSYSLQKIRHSNDIQKLLNDDKYIGLYSVLHGLNSARFKEKGIPESEWQSIFEYYFELYIVDSLLHTINEIFQSLNIGKSVEQSIVKNILSIFRTSYNLFDLTINGLKEYLTILRKSIDYQILNAPFNRKLDYDNVQILFTPGDLIFGIPTIIESKINEFIGVKFIYIFDEYEKLFEWQKKFINTMVWDKKTPVTFWIGARRYGYTTRETKTGESLVNGSEYQEVFLDEIMRLDKAVYKKFAETLYSKRLQKYYQNKGLNVSGEDIKDKFKGRFEAYQEEKLLSEIIKKNNKKEYKHLVDLRQRLISGIKENIALDLKKVSQIDSIIKAIVKNTDSNPLFQKYKIFFLYKEWFQSKNDKGFNEIISLLNKEFLLFKSKKDSLFDEIKEKRKQDFIAHLCKDNNIKNSEYLGVDKFIDLSEANPRTFLLILKKVIEYSKIKGEKPLEDGGEISLYSQYLAIYDTSRWFYEDSKPLGKKGREIEDSIKNLSDYFIIQRFCDKPIETSISCFSVKLLGLSQNALDCINLLETHSIIIEDKDGRKNRSSGIKESSFQINKILASIWNLPIIERGVISLRKEVAEAIFDVDFQSKFTKLYNVRKNELNAPSFGKKIKDENQITLF